MNSFFRNQPPSVLLLFSLEFWERFSYYGFLGVLILWMTASPVEGGLGWAREAALLLVGSVTGIMWLAPVAGGWVADRFIGALPAVIFGAFGIALGNALLAVAAFLPAYLFDVHALSNQTQLGALEDLFAPTKRLVTIILWLGLISIVVGAGLLKSNASALLSQQFSSEDPRRDRAFTIFYMGINLGAMAAPFGAGTLAEAYGWSYGFVAAAVGMIIGLIFFTWLAKRHIHVPTKSLIVRTDAAATSRFRNPGIRLVLIMSVFATIFMTGLMQYGGLTNLFGAERVDRTIGGFEIPATWFLSINPIVIILAGPLVVGLWGKLEDRRGRDLFVTKISSGLFLMAAAFLVLAAADAASAGGPVSPLFLIAFWIILTLGELCLMPVGLALIGRVAPAGTVGQLMGVWLLTMGLGSVIAGWLGALAQHYGTPFVFGLTAAIGVTGWIILRSFAGPMEKLAARAVE